MPIDDVKVHGSAVVWLTSEERGGGQAGGDRFLASTAQPVLGVLVPMEPDAIGSGKP
jgi:hypothetical protein